MKQLQLIIACVCGLLFTVNNANAQSWKDIFNSENISKAVDTVKEVTGTAVVKNITGTWSYSGSAVQFESDNLLNKAGGAVAASTVESKLDTQLSKVGIKAGATSFTFNEDGSFSSVIGKRTIKGTYTYDSSASTLNLKFSGLVGMNAAVTGSSNNMSLLFDADKLLQLVTFLGNKVNNTTIKSITALAESYDGMKLGMEMKK
ncbi:DUF4923 family protein [Bacteroides sp. 51]|uniref:DUF4923 family protein n=1 Tax=Bacteroides sp. 51 TaxID=2302938 RepID=UPI0013D3AD4E|nr:DUF4923 family protein [Bacteroides sp. 51]NDV82889.1 DUF4923 family protein [Bacteroides sp. 51]